jgi:hypothetical protein
MTASRPGRASWLAVALLAGAQTGAETMVRSAR